MWRAPLRGTCLHEATDVALDRGPHHIVDSDNVDPKCSGRLLAHDSAIDNGIHAVRSLHHLFRVGDINDLYLMGRLKYPRQRRTGHLRSVPGDDISERALVGQT